MSRVGSLMMYFRALSMTFALNEDYKELHITLGGISPLDPKGLDNRLKLSKCILTRIDKKTNSCG